jgi:hypothetical protein
VQAYASTAETGELEGGGQCDGQCDGTERQPERAADSVGWHEWAAFLSDQARARRARLDDGAQSRALRWRADALGVPYVLGLARQSDGSPRAISPELARELGAVPIGHNRGTLTVAMRDPGDTAAMRRLRLASGMAIFPVLVDQAELERALGEMERALARTTPTGL